MSYIVKINATLDANDLTDAQTGQPIQSSASEVKAAIYSDIYSTKEKAEEVAQYLTRQIGFSCAVLPYDSEPVSDGYDYDKYQ